MEFAPVTIFLLLLIKHTIADYFCQYSWMIKDKCTYGAFGGLAHSKFHAILTLLVLYLCGIPFLYSLLLSAFDGIAHYHIDYAKSNLWKRKKLTAADQLFWVAHGLDQLAHVLTYYVIVLNL